MKGERSGLRGTLSKGPLWWGREVGGDERRRPATQGGGCNKGWKADCRGVFLHFIVRENW